MAAASFTVTQAQLDQIESTVTAEQVAGIISTTLLAGANVTITTGTDGKVTIAATGGGGGGDLTEAQVKAIIFDTLLAGTNVTLDADSGTGHLTISASGGSGLSTYPGAGTFASNPVHPTYPSA